MCWQGSRLGLLGKIPKTLVKYTLNQFMVCFK